MAQRTLTITTTNKGGKTFFLKIVKNVDMQNIDSQQLSTGYT